MDGLRVTAMGRNACLKGVEGHVENTPPCSALQRETNSNIPGIVKRNPLVWRLSVR